MTKRAYVDKSLIPSFRIMLDSLEEDTLKVIIVDAPDQRHEGHKIRTVENYPSPWYQNFCRMYSQRRQKPRNRKSKYTDSRINRRRTLQTLTTICEKGFSQSIYIEDLIDIATNIKNIIEGTKKDQRKELSKFINTTY